jgi:tetratricopeptide (TPR) repeat protein
MTRRKRNNQLAAMIETSGLTYAALASAVRRVAAENGETLRTNKSTVDHWIQGARPAAHTGRYIAQALSHRLGRFLTEEDLGWRTQPQQDDDRLGLSLDTDPIESLLPIWSADLDRRTFLTTSAYSAAGALLPLEYLGEAVGRAAAAKTGKTVGMADVAAVRDMVSTFTEMDERLGGQHGRTALITYLRDDLAPLCRARFASEQAHDEILMVASRAVHLAGFKAYDAGEQGLAQRYYLQSFSLATESSVIGADGQVLRTMALQGLNRDRPEQCVALAECALSRLRRKADPFTEATFRSALAHTYANAGRRDDAVAEMNRSHELLAQRSQEDTPFWVLAWGPPEGTVHARIAEAFKTLGDHENAASQYARAAASRPVGTYARANALNTAAEARMHLKQGHIEAACGAWGRSLDLMAGLNSARTRKAVAEMRRELAVFRDRGVRQAAALDRRAVAVLASR